MTGWVLWEVGEVEGGFDLVFEEVVSASALEAVCLDLSGLDPTGDGVFGYVEELGQLFGGEQLGAAVGVCIVHDD